MDFVAFIKEFGPGIGGLAAATAFGGGVLWFLFKSAVSAAVKPDLNKINTRLDGLDQKVTNLDQKFTGLDQKFTSLDQKVTNLEGDVADLKQDVSDIKSGQETLISLVQGLVQQRTAV